MLSFKLMGTENFLKIESNSGYYLTYLGIILLAKENIPGKVIICHKFPAGVKILIASNSVLVLKMASLWHIQTPLQTYKLAMTTFSNTYENYLLIADLNMTPEDKNMIDFSNIFCLEHLMNKPTCFTPLISSCINLVLTK